MRQLPSKSVKAAWLQEEIYIRTKGYGRIEFKAAISSVKDKTTGTPGGLLKRLIQIIKEEKGRTPPEGAQAMESHIRKVFLLGTPTLQAKRFKAGSLFSIEDLRARREEFEAAEATRLKKAERARHDEHALEQPDEVAVGAELIGCHVEILTATQIPVVDAGGNDSMMHGKLWPPAVITKLPDGKDTKISANKKKIKIKAGWFFLEFDDG